MDDSEAGTYAHMFAGESKTGTWPVFFGGGVRDLCGCFRSRGVCLQGRGGEGRGEQSWYLACLFGGGEELVWMIQKQGSVFAGEGRAKSKAGTWRVLFRGVGNL